MKVLQCDCECHEYPEILSPELAKDDGWMVVNGKDICDWCLTGVVCHRWIPIVRKAMSNTEKIFEEAYLPVIAKHLENEVTFRKMFSTTGRQVGKAGERVTFSKVRK
jgi:hypothetical protein